MRGGMRMPPNQRQLAETLQRYLRFNEGRHAHAAESPGTPQCSTSHSRFNEGRHAHAAECHGFFLPVVHCSELQ